MKLYYSDTPKVYIETKKNVEKNVVDPQHSRKKKMIMLCRKYSAKVVLSTYCIFLHVHDLHC